MDKFDVIIIGSGLGGLSCGYILAKEGFRVCILEKHHTPGGNLQTFIRHGHKFETGVHYIGGLNPGQTLYRYWKYFGLTDTLPIQMLDPDGFDRIGFDDLEFPLAQGFSNFTEHLHPFFFRSKALIQQYVRDLHEIVSSFPLYNLELPENQQETHFISQSAFTYYKKFSSGEQLSAVLAGNNFLYAGTRNTPLHVAALINHSFISGACRIIGGSDQVSKILVNQIASLGGTILTNSEVTHINHTNSRFSVVTLNNEHYFSDTLISAIHPRTTLSLLPQKLVRTAFRERIFRLTDTPSSFILYLVMKPGSFPYLNHNYYYHKTGNVWDESDGDKVQWPAMYMLSTACHETNQRFAKTITILTYMNYREIKAWEKSTTGRRGDEYSDFKNEKAGKLLQLVEKKYPEIRSAIAYMEISTPLTWRDYTGTPEGSMYGVGKDYREPLHSVIFPKTKIPGFYFTGQNTNLHGVLGVTIGSALTCGEMVGLKYLIKKISDG